jgi:hypothetical protein
MQNVARRTIKTILLCLTWIFAIGASAAFAQGSAGGSIGNDEKSLSGSRATPRAVETEKPARRARPRSEPAEPRRAARRSGGGGGGGGNFDGAWMVTSVGCGGTTTGAVVVTSGRIIAEGVRGTVSSGGGVRTIGNFNGVSVTSSGRLSGRNGSGSFRRSDGCGGRWSASKQ